METWAQQDGSWVETGCAVLGTQHLGAQSTLQGDAFCFGLVFLRLNPNFSLQFVAPGGALDLQGVEGAANPSAGQTLGWAGGLGVPRLRWERGREIGCCCFLFLQPLLWTTRLRNPEQLLREHHPRPVLCAQGPALQDQGKFHLEVGKTTLAAFLCWRLAEGAESGTDFHLTHLLLRWWHPWVTLKTRPCSWIGTSWSRCLLGFLGGLSLFRKLFLCSLRRDEID